MKSESGADKRKFYRLEKSMPVKLITLNGSIAYDAVIKNISEGGILVEYDPSQDPLNEAVGQNTQLNVSIFLPERNRRIECVSDVVWIRQTKDTASKDKRESGIRFSKLDGEQKEALLSYINEMAGAEKKEFNFSKTVYLSDTNMEGNVYFARYFNWQGEAREEFYRQHYPLHLLQSGLKLITVNATTEFKHEAYLYDEININIKLENMKNMSVELVFVITNKNTKKTLALGRQKLAFGNMEGKLLPIPQEIREVSKPFLQKDSNPRQNQH